MDRVRRRRRVEAARSFEGWHGGLPGWRFDWAGAQGRRRGHEGCSKRRRSLSSVVPLRTGTELAPSREVDTYGSPRDMGSQMGPRPKYCQSTYLAGSLRSRLPLGEKAASVAASAPSQTPCPQRPCQNSDFRPPSITTHTMMPTGSCLSRGISSRSVGLPRLRRRGDVVVLAHERSLLVVCILLFPFHCRSLPPSPSDLAC